MLLLAQGAQLDALRGSGGMGWGLGGREAQRGEDACIHAPNSHCCIAEPYTTL